jgi:hypothetical protein
MVVFYRHDNQLHDLRLNRSYGRTPARSFERLHCRQFLNVFYSLSFVKLSAADFSNIRNSCAPLVTRDGFMGGGGPR